MRLYSSLLAFCISIAFSNPAWARWATPDDMDSSIEYRNTTIRVFKDGTFEEECEQEILISKESARMSRGVVRLHYNPEVSRMEIKTAETINPDGTLRVPRELIEDKPLASNGEGFDQWHQIMVAFPGVDVGSRIHLKWKLKTTVVPIPGFFSAGFRFGRDLIKAGTLRIESELPIYSQINDLQKQLDVRSSPHQIEVRIKSPILRAIIDEPNPLITPDQILFISFSTSRSWPDIGKKVGPEYKEILSAPLPETFRKIADQARGLSDPVEIMNAVTSRLSDQVRYLGDWRTLKGKWIPRPLETIAKSKFGDCKDFAATTTAILRSLGFDADVAWIWRGWNPVLEPYDLPSTYLFNHAIARVKVKDKVYWLDGTNTASFAQGIPGDISNRPAFVLSPSAELAKVRNPAPEDFTSSFSQKFDFSHPDGIRVDGSYRVHGQPAASWINADLNSSQDSIDFKLIRFAALSDQVKDWKVEGFKLKSRIAKDLAASFHYTAKLEGFRSTAGTFYPIPASDIVDRLLFSTETRDSGLFVGTPSTYRRSMVFSGISVVGKESLRCKIDSPWVSVSRKVASVSGGLKVTDELILKVPVVTHREYKTARFADLQRELAGCFKNSSVVYRSKKKLKRQSKIN